MAAQEKFTTLAKVKICLWIEWTDDDPQLICILDGVETYIEQLIWDINTGDKTEKIDISRLIELDTVPLCNKKVTKIKTVNWNDFVSKVDWTDYLIRSDDTVTIESLSSFLSGIKFNVFTIVYTSWYTTIPLDLQLIIADLVWYEYAKELGKNISKEKTWPRDVTYGTNESDPKVINALKVIENYKVLNLKYFT